MPEERKTGVARRLIAFGLVAPCAVDGFSVLSRSAFVPFAGNTCKTIRSRSAWSMIYAPPGSGYATPEDEKSELPDSYEPMMEFPGTMRPGRTPENMPFHDLPIADTDPDPVPWPHFQQIEWHHRWDPPHPHPIPMEEFIEQQGRWATPEMEAAMRAGNRRDARRRREMEEEQKQGNLIVDDDEDDPDEPQDLGEGMFGQLGSAADLAITSATVSPETEVDDTLDDDEDDGDMGDFLLDLGLDSFDDDEQGDEVDGDSKIASKKISTSAQRTGLEDVLIGGDDDDEGLEDGNISSDVTASIDVEEDDEMDLGLEEDEDLTDDGGVSTVPLDEDFDGLDNDGLENIFDDGGFDYDDGDGFDGGDSW